MKKDKEWLIQKVSDIFWRVEIDDDFNIQNANIMFDDISNLIDQLDEPEITEEQAWNKIAESYPTDAKSLAVSFEHFYYEGFAKKKPVIPQFMADYIEEWKRDGLTLGEWFTFDYDNDGEDKVAKWLYDNKDDETNSHREFTLIDAIRYGYEVGKEKKYYVLNHKGETMLYKTFEGIVYQSRGYKLLDIVGDEKDYQFTEAEIKAIDERFWAFAEEVTE